MRFYQFTKEISKIVRKYFFYISLTLFSTFFTTMFTTCKPPSRNVQTAFYYWKSALQITDFEADFLEKKQVKRLFLRSFDVILGGAHGAVPTPVVDLSDTNSLQKLVELKTKNGLEVVPTIFIANQIFKEKKEDLPQKIVLLLERIFKNKILFQEIQIDCDWTNETQAAYFDFLKQLAAQSQRKISATIRLHQVKFFEKTGVPPVVRGTLMAYNVGDMETAENSILNESDLQSYLKNFESYPLPLDVALPIYAWGVVVRDGRVTRLINGISAAEMPPPSIEPKIKQISPNSYEFEADMYFKSYYFYKNDRLRLESISSDLLLSSSKLLSEKIKNRDLTLTFYHLDSVNLARYEKDFFDQLVATFRR
ncbi:MAG: hypothetical protein RL757_2689 [Bacteroidota bacterium]|jgi:hypothetical protein